ncbi:MAG: glycoside hydrolase family 31 protein [Bacteroidota bacterium]
MDQISVPPTRVNNSLGDLVSHEITKTGIKGSTTFGSFEISVYSANVFRIKVWQGDLTSFSYAVISEPVEVDFAIEASDNALVLATSAMQLQITKQPVRFSLINKDGHVVNEDDTFGTSWIGEQVTTYKKLQKGERFIGLGEKTGPLDRKGNGYINWNTDNFGYDLEGDPLYSSIPFYIGLHNSLAYGLYFDNTYKSYFNFGASNNRFSSFSADGGSMDYYLIHHDNVADIIKSYTELTGRMELPPLWSLGYQQCRYSYYPDLEIETLANTFRDKNIPADAIVLDIHYMDEYKIFTWHPEHFSNPKKLIDQVKSLGFEIVIMCDPGIKIEDEYSTYTDGVEKDVFLKYPDNTYYTGEVWPGWCHFPDFTNPATRAWWGSKFNDYVELGVEGFWNDMNEISTWGNMMPELVTFNLEGHHGTSRQGRNLYGFQMARSTYEGVKKLMDGKRPFVLTRSGFAGVQRYSAVWTGDNVSDDEHMLLGVRIVNSLGLSGVAFAGYDVGGFVGEASGALFARWISLGALSPFFRGHTMINSRDAEPWSFGEEVEEISRNYIRLRYALMPYIYSLFFDATQTGMPVSRSLAIDYSFDSNIYQPQFENQYLFGPSILVAPVTSDKEITKVYLPEGEWYNFHNDSLHKGGSEVFVECPLDKLPIFIKAGGMIPMQTPGENTATIGSDILEIHLYKGSETNTFEYYEDDGKTYDFATGDYLKRVINYEPTSNQLVLSTVEGNFPSKFKAVSLIFHGFDDLGDQIDLNGERVSAEKEDLHFLEPITKFDPFTPGGTVDKLPIQKVVFDHTKDEVTINW